MAEMKRKCQMCGCEEYSTLYTLRTNGKIFGKTSNADCVLVSCKGCGLVSVEPGYKQSELSKHYANAGHNYHSTDVFGNNDVLNAYHKTLSTFQELISKDAAILDIGGGDGEFGLYLKQQGYGKICVMEMSDACLESIRKAGLTAIKSTFDIPDEYIGRYDLIVCMQTLEHILDMKSMLLNAQKMLKAGGYLYIDVPDATRYSDESSAPYASFPYEHVYHFGPNDLRNIAKALGCELVAVEQFRKWVGFDVVCGLYRNVQYQKESIVYSNESSDAILRYVAQCKARLNAAKATLVQRNQPLIFWGMGSASALILDKTFDDCNVKQLIDSSAVRQGDEYKFGSKVLQIQKPSDIADDAAIIVVLSYWFRYPIIKQIRSMGYNNTIAVFGEVNDTMVDRMRGGGTHSLVFFSFIYFVLLCALGALGKGGVLWQR